MASPRLAVRVDEALLEWVDGYAAARGSSRSAVVNAALAEFRELARRGVPDLELAPRDGRSAPKGNVSRRASPSSPGPAAPVAPRSSAGAARAEEKAVREAREWIVARQAKLNQAKQGR